MTCAIVTGASSGIGAATALAFAARDISVVATARRPERLRSHDSFEETADRLDLIPADLTKPDDIEAVFAHAEETHGGVRYVVHSVGFEYRVGWYRDATADEIAGAIAALFTSPALVLNRAIQSMRASGGTIGLVSSGAANRPTPGRALYSSAKIAMLRLVQSVAAECESEGGNTGVFAILPGRVDTPGQRRLMAAAQDADRAFRLERFKSDDDVFPAEAVGEAFADLVLRPAAELNGLVLRYQPDGWTTEP
jgi:NAD(P)-dependent dehydrogenase (short-subunit alcohol dehydrogenase family)